MAHPSGNIREYLGFANVLFVVVGLFIVYSLAVAIYNVTFHPLAKLPGPKLRAAFHFPYNWNIWNGTLVAKSRELHDRYGSIVRTAPGTVSFNSFSAWDDIYIDRVGKKAIPKDPTMYFNPDGVADLIGSNDADHARIRRLISHALSKSALYEGESLQKPFFDTVIKKLHSKIDGPTQGKVDLVHWMTFTIFDLIGDLTFGESFDALETEQYNFWIANIFTAFKMATSFAALGQYPLISAPIFFLVSRFPALERAKRKHERYSLEKAERRLAAITERNDLMSYIIRHNDEKGMTRQEIIKLSANFIIAGSEPVATTLCGALYYLLKDPQTLQRLTEEVRKDFADPEEMTFKKLEDHKYLDACVQEALRIYPAIPSMLPRRTLKGGAIIDGVYIPENVRVGIHQWSTYHSKENFVEPDRFIPERWLGDPRYANDARGACNPFSVGRRNCAGQYLARAQVRAVLARMVWHFDMKLCNESDNWENQKVFIFWDKPPLMVQLARRPV